MIETDMYRDGGSVILFNVRRYTYYVIDYRIGSSTIGVLYENHPTVGKIVEEPTLSNIIHELETNEIKYKSDHERITVRNLIDKHNYRG